MDARQHSLPASRNREPILGVLKHVVYFAKHLRDVEWQPSDPDPNARASVAAWIEEEGVSNIAAPLDLDVSELGWERALAGQTVDAMLAVNMIHISPWEATLGLMRGARAILSTATRGSGVLYTYGAYKRGGAHTAPSNEAFDAWLKERDERFGVRDLEAVEAIASDHGFMLSEIVEMPANNLSLVFELQAPTKP
jgi:hypothetical protein